MDILECSSLTQKSENVWIGGTAEGDGILEVLKRTGVLLQFEIDQAEIVVDSPVKWLQEEGLLQAGNGGNEFVFACKADANVIPKRGTLENI